MADVLVGTIPVFGASEPASDGSAVGPLFGGKVFVEVPAEGLNFLEEVELWEVLLEFANEENIGCSEEGKSGEMVFEVVDEDAGVRVRVGDGRVLEVIHESSPVD